MMMKGVATGPSPVLARSRRGVGRGGGAAGSRQSLWILAFATCLLLSASHLLISSCRLYPVGPPLSSAAFITPCAGPPSESGGQRVGKTDLRQLQSAWNLLHFGRSEVTLRIAAFVRKWPSGGTPGGLESHALTLYQALSDRGHDVHVFTMLPGHNTTSYSFKQGNLSIHSLALPAANGSAYDQAAAWAAFLAQNRSQPFDIVHTESVALHHSRAQGLPNLVASWHGIAFEVIHSDIVSELTRAPNVSRGPDLQRALSERLFKVSDEIRFFSRYRHHIAISDYVGDVLQTIYEIPTENVHIILNGVNSSQFHPASERGLAMRRSAGVLNATALVLGVDGRLVKDKGHTLLLQALPEFLSSNRSSSCSVYLLVAGDGPWPSRYRELSSSCVKVLAGAMVPSQMADFYNAIDVFVNPTLRAEGLDLTLLEAMLSGKPLLATRFSSITRSVIVDEGVGYTFSPNVASLATALRQVVGDGKKTLVAKGQTAFRRASQAFTSSKMGLAYERLFLCIAHPCYCEHPLKFDYS